MAPNKLFVLAGEVSGDLHASAVIGQLMQRYPGLEVFGTGGERMRQLGARLLYDTRQLSVMGFVEVLRHGLFLRRVVRELKQEIVRQKPDVALLVDYPAMNLIMARFLHEQGVPVIYYISPKVWAWKEGRVRKMKRSIDRLLVIFRFEVDFFARRGMQAEYVGNPVAEELEQVVLPLREDFFHAHSIQPGSSVIGLLPGSRRQEIEMIYPRMLEAAGIIAAERPSVFLLGTAPGIDDALYGAGAVPGGCRIIRCSACEVMKYSDAALVTSGTATLEALCFGLPMVVVYRTGKLNYMIGKRLVRLHNISLANIVALGPDSDRQIVPELLQEEVTGCRMAGEVLRILEDPAVSGRMKADLLEAREGLCASSASETTASVISSYFTT
ncbi:lipid-A-disaccharide synthase [Prosthecochloris sp. HL-130-GSB]|jgi:lipid-A-disaccharide synthase|uniref:Lipid-A-disaccharide synthase n=1 Tax=Prosthecochloris aestuarii TaxID=1102 RepID=A0A831SQP7_PROAE|nr:lipid-A-disaccharide synthase [Prosthecochloris sp. HL-130-GSB]ARM30315.1 lipid-A-disaccharide synthase [Prosthecochloris sp. HL-130-GSB]MBO8091936.1 lipid-A-disaccharide synthase [Prosthecochloris sp.]HED30375.1 lipid-A-disaccharide synthase [Prosthecochloris aestuarii]